MVDLTEGTIIENELKRIQVAVFEAWKIYMTWYTWFFGANLLVLGWIFTRGTNPIKPRDIVLLAGAWIIFNIFGIVSSMRLRAFTLKAKDQGATLSRRLAESTESKSMLVSDLGFPSELGRFGALANAISLGINCVLWLYLLLRAL
jgi:hypothetical protein